MPGFSLSPLFPTKAFHTGWCVARALVALFVLVLLNDLELLQLGFELLVVHPRTELRVEAELNDRQRWVDPEADIAPPPPGYALLGASIETTLALTIPLRIGIQGTNLLNTSYRDYTSLLRYYADQPGWDLRVRVGTNF